MTTQATTAAKVCQILLIHVIANKNDGQNLLLQGNLELVGHIFDFDESNFHE